MRTSVLLPTPEPPSPAPELEPGPGARVEVVTMAAIIVGVVAAVGGLYFARGFLLPVVLALMLRLVLGPVVRALKVSVRVPEPVGAAMVLLTLLLGVVLGGYQLTGPAFAWLDTGPESIRRVESKLRALRKPVDQVTAAADRVERIATGGAASDPAVQAVTIKPTTVRDRIFSHTSGLVTAGGMMLVLLFFLLASGDLFLRKLVRILPTLGDKKLAVEVARSIESNISRYLLSIALINTGLGITVAIAMWLVGLPNPALWGVMVGVFNFVPYVGPLTSQIVLLLVGVMTFDSLGYALVPPAIYFAIDVVESNFVTPMVLGKRLELNTVVIFLAVSFWTWLWGVAGALLAVPMLATVKILCDSVEPLAPVAEMLNDD